MFLDFELNSFYIVVSCVIFTCHAASQSFTSKLNITRGDQDAFTNPVPGSPNCDNLGAHCPDDCRTCQCEFSKPTFNPTEGSHGKCVKNDKFLFSIGGNLSFLVYQRSMKVCMHPLAPSTYPSYVTASKSCDVSNITQHWIWTKNMQLLNLFTLKCLQMSDVYSNVSSPFNFYPRLALDFCNASNSRQLWRCGGRRKHVFVLRSAKTKKYMNFGNTNQYVILYDVDGGWSIWSRNPPSNDKTLCDHSSSYNGCYRYSDGSAMFLVNMETCKYPWTHDDCIKKKDIEAPIEATNNQCSIQWELTQYFNYSDWELLPFREDIFTIVERNHKPTLKTNLTGASSKWYGQIIKLYIHCINSRLRTSSQHQTDMGVGETHCVLIKFTGTFKILSWPYSTESTPLTTFSTVSTSTNAVPNPTGSTARMTHSPREKTESSIATAPVSTGSTENVSHPSREKTQSNVATSPTGSDENVVQPSKKNTQSQTDSSEVIIIVMSLLGVLLVIGSIFVYVFCKRKRCLNAQNSRANKREDRDIATGSPSSNHIEETENPIYSTEDDSCQNTLRKRSSEDQVPGLGAVSECELYEPSEDHIYNSIQGDQNKNDPKSHENNYDYATRDYVLLMRQQCPPEGQAQYNSNTKNYPHYPHERNFVQIEQGKVGLKTGQAEDGPVYQIPDQGEIDLNKDRAEEGPVYQDVEQRETDLKKDQAKEGPVYHVLGKGKVATNNDHGEEDPVYHVLEKEVGLKYDQAVKSLVYDVLEKGEIGLHNHGSEEDPTYQVVEV